MYKTIQKFFKHKQKPVLKVVKGLLKGTLFAIIIASSVFPIGNLTSLKAAAPLTANAATCAVAAGIANGVNHTNPKVGDTVIFTLVGAPSFTVATHVVVTDPMPAGLTFVSSNPSVGTYNGATGIWDLGTLSTGAHIVTSTITATIDASAAGKTITNTPSITYTGVNGCAQSDAATTATLTVQAAVVPPPAPSADISVTKAVDNSTPHEGDTVNYTVTVKDLGSSDSTGVVATDALPAGLSFVSAIPSTGTFVSSTGVWTIGNVLNGASATLAIAAKVNAGTASTTITNTATVGEAASITDPNTANNTASASLTVQRTPVVVPPSADISIAKSVDVTSTNEGATVHYAITVKDLGPDASTAVVSTDALPSGLTLISANPSVGTYVPSTGAWTIGDLSNGASATLAIAATVNAGQAGNTITNTATVGQSTAETDPNAANNTASTSFTVKANAIGTCSVAAAFADGVDNTNPKVGDVITYTLFGAPALTAATHVTVTDILGSGLTFVSASSTPGTYTSATGIWDLGTINGSSIATLVLKAKVNAGTEGQTITNTPSVNYVQSNCTQTSAVTGISIAVQSAPTSTPNADLSVAKSVDNATPHEGNTVNYTIAVKDLGPATSTGVVANDVLPSGITFVSATSSIGSYATSTGIWTIGDLSPSATATLAIAATVNAGTAGTTITNTAIAGESALSNDPNLSNNSSSVSIVVQPNGGCGSSCPVTADIGVIKTVDNATPKVGDIVHYTVAVADHGPDTSTGVAVHDLLPSSALSFVSATTSQGSYSTSTGDWTIGTVAASATATLTIAAQVASDQAGKTIVNTATVSELSTITDNNLTNNSSSVSIVVVAAPVTDADLSVVKTVDASTTVEGATLHYTIAITDLGPATSTGVVATDTLPLGLTFQNATASVGTYATSTGIWTIGDLSPSSTATLAIAATVNAGQAGNTITNTAIASESASSTDSNLANNSSSVSTFIQSTGGCGSSCPVADIAVNKTVDNANPNPGDTINYTVVVTDNGPATSTNVSLHDQLPPTTALSLLSATTSQGSSYNMTTGDWAIGTVGPNATATLKIAVVVGSNQAGQSIANTATVIQLSSIIDPHPDNNSSTVVIHVQTPGVPNADLSVAKSVDNATPHEGDTVNYTIAVKDLGPATSTGVVATDTLPSGLTFVSATSSIGSYATSTGVWTIGDLNVSSTATLAIAAKVNSGTAGTTITNIAIAGESTSTVDNNLANNSSSVSIAVQGNGGGGCGTNCGGGGGGTPTGEIGIVKTVDNANPAAGATIHYTLTVSATGPSPSLAVVANDILPSGVTFVSATSSLGTYDNTSGTWTIGQMDNGQKATLTITATVNSSDTPGQTITNTGTVKESPAVNDQNSGNNTSSVTITVAGGGGGGGGTVSVPSGGGGGGAVLGASTSTGQVLGASACGIYLNEYIHPVRKYLNTPSEVMKLQTFLNQNLGSTLPVTGYYGSMTITAVNQFQVKYHTEVLLPWVPLGLPNEFTPTRYVYQTTQRWINLIMCPTLNIPMPTLVVDQGGE